MVHRLQRCLQIENHTFSAVCPGLGCLGSLGPSPGSQMIDFPCLSFEEDVRSLT